MATTLSFFLFAYYCRLLVLHTSFYFVEGEGLAHFPHAPSPATIPHQIPVSYSSKVMTEDLRSPAFNRIPDAISRRVLVEAEGSDSPESPGYRRRRKVAMTIKNRRLLLIKDDEESASPENSPGNAAAAVYTKTAYLSAGKVGAPASFPEVKSASRINRELIEADASVSPESPGY